MAHEQTYTVQEGDTLSGIAEEQLGDAFTITNSWQSSVIATAARCAAVAARSRLPLG